ncbi:hypothetical protein QBC43DRAFT_304845 [Cladorrhinum sp. PSN259]|nr:hypothetical protein QBC43DRAFT_304845 [Cladorrhinum sp. PSN259]
MCVQTYRVYTCGCKKPEEFKQCEARLGTNVKCTPVTREDRLSSPHMCSTHMVKQGAHGMRLDGGVWRDQVDEPHCAAVDTAET